jgi:hypothetical protein
MYAEFFLPRKLRAAALRDGSGASSQTLSSRASCVVHAFSDMDVMPNSQWLLRFNGFRPRRRRDGVREAAAVR